VASTKVTFIQTIHLEILGSLWILQSQSRRNKKGNVFKPMEATSTTNKCRGGKVKRPRVA